MFKRKWRRSQQERAPHQATAVGAVVVLAALITGAAVARESGQQSGVLGPAEGEALGAWAARWLDGPVQYVATEDERRFYQNLETTQERLEFIRLFWERRDPQIRGPENEFLQEFQGRVAYANENFSNGRPGWQTVFGRMVLVLGPPARTRRELSLPAGLSDRPAILWSYDKRIRNLSPNEDLLFVFRFGKWRLWPPYPMADQGVESQLRELERSQGALVEIPTDYLVAMQFTVEETLIHPVDYEDAIRRVRAVVEFPDTQIPFGWEAEFGAGEGKTTHVELKLTWRMGSLIFHVVDDVVRTEMVVRAVLLDDDEPVAEISERISIEVPVDELQARGDDLVDRTIRLRCPGGQLHAAARARGSAARLPDDVS